MQIKPSKESDPVLEQAKKIHAEVSLAVQQGDLRKARELTAKLQSLKGKKA